MVFLLLFLKVLIFVLLGGMAFFALTTRWIITSKEKQKMVFLFSLGMGPPIASLLLYYLFVLIPGLGSLFYLLVIVGVFLVMLSFNRKATKPYVAYLQLLFNNVISIFKMNKTLKRYFFGISNISFWILLISWYVMTQIGYHTYFYLSYILLFFLGLLAIALSKSIRKKVAQKISTLFNFVKDIFTLQFDRNKFPFFKEVYEYLFLTNNFFVFTLLLVVLLASNNILLSFSFGHDFLEYMVQGGYIFDNKEIAYTTHVYNPQTGFYYVGLHGWSFPLQFTLGRLVDDVVGVFGYGLYFQSLTLWYGLVILTLVYAMLKQHLDTLYALAAVWILIFAKGFLIAISYSHIDSYRIFFFSLSILLTLEMIHKPQAKMVPLLAFVAGISAFSHSLGVLVSIILAVTLCLFLEKKWVTRLKYAFSFALLTLLFGGVHYLLDVFYGTGWIFKEIDFY